MPWLYLGQETEPYVGVAPHGMNRMRQDRRLNSDTGQMAPCRAMYLYLHTRALAGGCHAELI
jgi:hypothetical protein